MKPFNHQLKKYTAALLFLLVYNNTFAQLTGIAINDNNSIADASAMLDVNINSAVAKKGFLIPPITTTERDAIVLPAKSLWIFNLTNNRYEYNSGTPASPVWVQVASSLTAWLVAGNSGTTSGNFMGSTDNISLRFRTLNIQRMMMDSLGSVGIGSEVFTAAPNREKLLVDAGVTTSYNVLGAYGSINNSMQLSTQNKSTGTGASTNMAVTADNGNRTTNYANFGINGSGYTGGVFGSANDAYLYNTGQNLLIGTGTAAKSLAFLTGGTSQAANERMRISGTGLVGIGTNTPGAMLHVKAVGGSSTLELEGITTGTIADNLLSLNTATSIVSTLSTNSFWRTVGNTGTTPGTNFIGTTDGVGLQFKVGNTSAGFLDNNVASGNTFFGKISGNYSTTTGLFNVAFGTASLTSNTSGSYNSAIGFRALNGNTSGAFNTALGYNSLLANTTASNNTALGYNSLAANTTGNNNTAVGYANLPLAAGIFASNNTAVGYNNMPLLTNNCCNTALGSGNLLALTTGNANTAIGAALPTTTTGTYNIGIGSGANNTSASANYSIIIGFLATSNSSNTIAIGDNAKATNASDIGIGSGVTATGGPSLAIGYQASATGSGATAVGRLATANAVNATAIGIAATTAQNNALVLGDNATVNVGIGTSTPNTSARLDVAGSFKMGINGSLLAAVIKAAVVADPPSVPAAGRNTFNLTVTNTAINSSVIVNPRALLTAGIIIAYSYVGAVNTVTVVLQNTSIAAIDLLSQTWDVTAFQ